MTGFKVPIRRPITTILACASSLSAPISLAHGQAAEGVPRYSERVRETRYVAVRDGTRLAVSIYRPAVNGKAVDAPFPVVFGFTPYRHRYRDAQGKIVEAIDSPSFATRTLTDYGYVVAFADIRGKGASFGHRRGFQDRTEARDGYDLVQWLAGQSWSTGRVGMSGCSYNGGTTVQVATTRPPALKAIFTGASDLDKYSFVRRGGIPAQFNTRPDEAADVDLASVPVDADKDGAMLRAAVGEHAANTPMAPLWYGMTYRDDVSPLTGNAFWGEVGPYTYLKDLKASGIQTYFWGNWQDEPTEQVMQFAANMGSRLLIGPGSHCVPPPGYDLDGEVRRYFDLTLKGQDHGLSTQPKVTWWFDEGNKAGRWVRAAAIPGATGARTTMFLTDAAKADAQPGKLADRTGALDKSSFSVDYGVGSPDYFAFWIDPMVGQGLVWQSEPLATARALIGFPVIRLNVAADRADTNIFAYLEDVGPDGKAVVVSFGRLAASQRQLAKPPYANFGLPWHSGRRADALPLKPGVAAPMAFELTPAGRMIPAGHRLRIRVTGADPRQRNLADLRQDPPPTITIISGGPDASRIEVPFAQTP